MQDERFSTNQVRTYRELNLYGFRSQTQPGQLHLPGSEGEQEECVDRRGYHRCRVSVFVTFWVECCSFSGPLVQNKSEYRKAYKGTVAAMTTVVSTSVRKSEGHWFRILQIALSVPSKWLLFKAGRTMGSVGRLGLLSPVLSTLWQYL